MTVEITSKDNLRVFWHPTGIVLRTDFENTDWAHWWGDEGASFYGRSSNELMFIRGVGKLRVDPEHRWSSPERMDMERIALYAAIAAVRKLMADLAESFEVRRVTDFDIVTEGVPDPDHPEALLEMKRIRYWEIYDVAARASDPDDAWVAGFPERYGITIPEMLWLIEETSGANSPTLKSLCRSHGLKKLGHESHWHREIVWRIRRLVRKGVIDAKPVPIGEGISPDAPPQEPPTRAPQPDPETS